ncbi:unnamed protein product [Auanema sp. JU1783]|nr:unnamed protein product [Auanema sp. JU1783]
MDNRTLTPLSCVSNSRVPLRHFTPRTQPQQPLRMDFDEDSFDMDSTFMSSENLSSVEDAIRRFTSSGDFSTAVLFIDASYAKQCEGDTSLDIVKFARHIQALASVHEWMRIRAMLEETKLFRRHIFFAYFYISALFHLRLYTEIRSAPLGPVLEQAGVPTKYFQLVEGVECGGYVGECTPLNAEDARILQGMVDDYKLNSGMLLVYGRTFLILEYREAACRCLSLAFMKDRDCLLAQQLLTRYKLLDTIQEAKLKRLVSERSSLNLPLDPRVRSVHAEELLGRGDASAAFKITNDIIKKHGIYMDCILTHIGALTQLENAEELFLLAHRLVDTMPDHEYAWYAVSMYYFACKNIPAAKNFMNKATMMNTGFGEGWLAYGHILSADSENDQALNCYYRASRILERHFEPLLYVAKQYCKSGVKLADQFLEDAAKLSPTNPIVIHEQGTLAYNKCDFPASIKLLHRALSLVLFEDPDLAQSNTKPLVQIIRNAPINEFWEPLINNLGHCSRRLGANEDAIAYHQRALLMNPRNVQALTSIAMAYAALGEIEDSAIFFHKSLAICPYDELTRAALEAITSTHADFVVPKQEQPIEDKLMSSEELDKLLSRTTPVQKKAC